MGEFQTEAWPPAAHSTSQLRGVPVQPQANNVKPGLGYITPWSSACSACTKPWIPSTT